MGVGLGHKVAKLVEQDAALLEALKQEVYAWFGRGGAWGLGVVWSIRTPHRGHQQNPTSINITTVSDCSCLCVRLADTAVLLCCVCCCCCSCLVLRVCGWRGARPTCLRQHSNGTAAAAVVVYLYVRLHAAFLAVSQCTLQGCLQQQAGFRICLSDANMLLVCWDAAVGCVQLQCLLQLPRCCCPERWKSGFEPAGAHLIGSLQLGLVSLMSAQLSTG